MVVVTGKLSENSLAVVSRLGTDCRPGSALGDEEGDRKWTVLNIQQIKAEERLLYSG